MDPNNRLNDRLRATRTAGHGALLPYFTAGFPDPDTAAALIRRADHLGVAVVEIGFPYADSIADGPVIQASFHHALTHGYRLRDAFALAETVRPSVACGLVAMVSFSIVHRVGVDAFMAQAASAGFDGVILPDLPIDEADASATVAHRAGLCHIGLVAPTTPPERGVAIARASSGFVYRIAVAGTTGERSQRPRALAEDVARLQTAAALPVCVGFGISKPDHVRHVCRFADGAIVGSALVRRINEAVSQRLPRHAVIDTAGDFIADLMSGLTDDA